MAEDRLKLDTEQMKEQAEKIQSAVEDYKSFADKLFDVEIGYLDAMNTDFTAKLVTMLEDLNDSDPDLIKKLEEIGKLTQSVMDTFEKADQDMAENIGITAVQ